MEYRIFAETDKGPDKEINQDSLYAARLLVGKKRMAFAVLCDGMGGLKKGETASASVTEAYASWAKKRLPPLCAAALSADVLFREWNALAFRCHERVKAYGRQQNLCGIGTTIVVLLLTDSSYFILSVGDTRAYQVTKKSCQLLTHDHTLVAREVAQGRLSEEQAKRDPRRSVLLQGIGASEEVKPDVFSGKTKRGAVYMLCSDGFRRKVSDEEIAKRFCPKRMKDEEMMKCGGQEFVALNRKRLERDNISVITIRTV